MPVSGVGLHGDAYTRMRMALTRIIPKPKAKHAVKGTCRRYYKYAHSQT